MKTWDLKAGLVSLASAIFASLCCLLPLGIVLLGLGTGAFMMVTMQYRTVLLPLGVIGLTVGYYLYFRQKRRCATAGCAFRAGTINLALLLLATAMVAGALFLDLFPEFASSILQGAM